MTKVSEEACRKYVVAAIKYDCVTREQIIRYTIENLIRKESDNIGGTLSKLITELLPPVSEVPSLDDVLGDGLGEVIIDEAAELDLSDIVIDDEPPVKKKAHLDESDIDLDPEPILTLDEVDTITIPEDDGIDIDDMLSDF